MPDSKQKILDYFRDQAGRYDWGVRAYRLMGIDEGRCRRDTVKALAPGDTVIDLACGTRLNFPLLAKTVGASGKLIGVDISPEMLDRARRRVEKAGWGNVELAGAWPSSTPNIRTGRRSGQRFSPAGGSSRSGSTRNSSRSGRWIPSAATCRKPPSGNISSDIYICRSAGRSGRQCSRDRRPRPQNTAIAPTLIKVSGKTQNHPIPACGATENMLSCTLRANSPPLLPEEGSPCANHSTTITA